MVLVYTWELFVDYCCCIEECYAENYDNPHELLVADHSDKLVMAVEAGSWEVPDAVAFVGTPVEPGKW